jgi:hypothetical protein
LSKLKCNRTQSQYPCPGRPARGAMEAISLQCWTEGFFRQPKAKALTAEAVNEVDAEEVDAERPPRDKKEEEEGRSANGGRDRGERRRRRRRPVGGGGE